MRFQFIADEHIKVKTFLKKHEVSKGLLAKIKFRGGDIRVKRASAECNLSPRYRR